MSKTGVTLMSDVANRTRFAARFGARFLSVSVITMVRIMEFFWRKKSFFSICLQGSEISSRPIPFVLRRREFENGV